MYLFLVAGGYTNLRRSYLAWLGYGAVAQNVDEVTFFRFALEYAQTLRRHLGNRRRTRRLEQSVSLFLLPAGRHLHSSHVQLLESYTSDVGRPGRGALHTHGQSGCRERPPLRL